MSTEHQQYSTENQAEALRRYAHQRSIEIVRTYADEGRSRLRLDGRDALKQLIKDVESGAAATLERADRWGGFSGPAQTAVKIGRLARVGFVFSMRQGKRKHPLRFSRHSLVGMNPVALRPCVQ